jgi:putative ABC transport system substrate-binding protein
VSLKVDVLIASGTKAGLSAKRATTTVPIVVSNMGDAVGAGFIADYAHPGGNVTGMSLLSPELAGKQLELLRLVKPRTPTAAVLVNPANPNTTRIGGDLKREAGIAVEPMEAGTADEIQGAFVKMRTRHIDALLVQSETLFVAHAKTIADRAIKGGIASAGTFDYVHAGGLIGYSTNRMEAWRYLVGYVDKILKGAKPAELPVEQPTKYELVINMKTAKALSLTLPQSLLIRADEVIQ